MSYRDLRYFTEMLRALDYPQLISMEGFRTPNFPLVAAILVWLAKRLDPDTDLPTECGTEDERVALIRAVAQFMALKINVKVNTKRLYQADGYAVKEMLKVTSLLYDAFRQETNKSLDESDDNIISLTEFDISDKINDLKQSRQLASEITTNGAALYDLLGKEVDLRTLRHISVGRQFELGEVEAGVRVAIDTVRKELDETKELINNVTSTEANLDGKIERRKVELDRYEKRLQTLKKVKPAFLEEFSKAEQELQSLYEQYVVRYRCMMYLEQKFAEVERSETERMQQHIIATRRLVEQLRLEEHLPEEGSEPVETGKEEVKRPERPRANTESRNRQLKSSKVYGSMNPSSMNGASTGSSSDSDSEDMLLDGEEPELAGSMLASDDDSLALEISAMDKRAATAGRRTSNQARHDHTDDDF